MTSKRIFLFCALPAAFLASVPAQRRVAYAQGEPPAPGEPPPAPVPAPAPAISGPSSAQPSSAPAADAGAVTWTAGYHNGTFFLRDKTDIFRLYVLGRVHADWLNQLGAGTSSLPPGSGIENGFFLRRARLELAGEFYQVWQWWVAGEFASATSIDNAAATQSSPTCSVNTTTSFVTCQNRENPVDSAAVKAIPTDVFVNYGPSPWANVQVGQYYLPFTLENRISDNTTPFLERSLAVRNLGAPLQRDIGAMFWGESPERSVYYAVALLNGDGPNRPNVDGRYDVSGRFVVRPFALSAASDSPTKWAQVGVSARAGSRDPAYVGYDLPSLTTQGGFAFWKPTYKDSFGRTLHIIPSNLQWAVAGDLYLPIENFDFTGEFIYAQDDTREAVDGMQISPFVERTGQLKGFGWYAQIGYWLLGDHDVVGQPSYGRPIHLDLTKPQKRPQEGVEVLAKFEQLKLSYDGALRGGVPDPQTPDGDIKVDALEFGVNYWATRHMHVGVNYSLYVFPGSAPVTPTVVGGKTQSSDQRAVAPGQLLAKGVDDPARDQDHTINEIQARVAVQF